MRSFLNYTFDLVKPMKLLLKHAVSILLCAFVALSLVQAGGAAPPNPDLNKYLAEENTTPAEMMFTDIESQNSDSDEWNNRTNIFPDTTVCITASITTTLRVPSDNYSTIQSAVDAACPGDTVIVESGTYHENIAITTPITLRGIDTGDGFPVIDACGNGTALSVTADGVTIEGFSLTGGGEKYTDAGLYVKADNTSLINLSVRQNADIGINVDDSENTTITGCSADENGSCGIIIYLSPGSTLNDCSAYSNEWGGIGIAESPGSTLNNCSANDNGGRGIQIEDYWIEDYTSVFEAGTDTVPLPHDSNDIQPLMGVDDTDMDDETLFREFSRIPSYDRREEMQEMSISGEGNIPAASGYTGVNLTGCRADRNDECGILIWSCRSVVLDDCRFTGNREGLFLSSVENCCLTNNSMEGNRFNFGIYGSNECNYIHSIDTSNTVNGKPIYYLLNATGNPEGDFADAGTIYAVNCTGLNIHDLTLSGNSFGIYFWNTASSTIRDVTTQGNQNGIRLEKSSNISIINCRPATENECSGIELWNSERCVLTGNAMEGNSPSFAVIGQEDAEYLHSIDTSNTINGRPIYYLVNTTANPEGDFADAGTIYAVNCTGLDIHDLTLSNEYAGVLIRDCSGLDIHDLTLTENCYALDIRTSTNITLDTITATENGHAIYMKDCFESTIQNINATNNEFGILCFFSDTIDIPDCTIEESEWWCFNLAYCKNCTVSRCSFIDRNTDHNDWWRMSLRGSSNCIFSLNSIVNNTLDQSGAHDLLWNSPTPLTYLYGEWMWKKTSPMGNYWGAAYSGTDLNGDGIGDTPFTGDGFTDTYPLMEPLSAYTFVEDTGSDDDDTGEHDIEATGNLKAGDSVDMQFRGTAVTNVTITTAENIDLVTLRIAPASDGPDGLNGPVYQYLEADLIHATDDEIAGADFTFSVPTAWLTAQGLTPADVVLWRFHDGVWVPLPTEVAGEEGDHVVFRAVSPGFSYFAIGEGEAAAEQPAETAPSVGTDEDTETLPADTSAPTQVNENTAEPTMPSTPADEAVPAGTPPQKSPAGLCSILAACGIAGMLLRRY